MFTDEQLKTVYDALKYARTARLDEFEQDKDSREVEAIQRAIRAARDAKRFNEVLFCVRQQLGMSA